MNNRSDHRFMMTCLPPASRDNSATRDMTDSTFESYLSHPTIYMEEDECEMNDMDMRIGRSKLEHIARDISNRDVEILKSTRDYRYLTTDQLRRLYFRDSISDIAALRSANRILAKLKGLELLRPLTRRIGGVRAGSASFIWALSPTGARLLDMQECAENPKRKRFREPRPSFLEHTLAVAELSIRLMEMSFLEKSKLITEIPSATISTASSETSITLIRQELEPICWRIYAGIGGAVKTLKPDLFTITSAGEYDDYTFWEVDLSTEAPSQVVRKCEQYIAYRHSGVEQRNSGGVFPSVVWLVPTEKRKNSLKRHIDEMRGDNTSIFTVITMDELYALVELGVEGFKKQTALGVGVNLENNAPESISGKNLMGRCV